MLTDAPEWVGTYNATHADAIDVVNMSIGGVGGNDTWTPKPATRWWHRASWSSPRPVTRAPMRS